MTYKFFLALAFLLVISTQQVIGTCQDFSNDGLSCQKCVDNHHLYEGSCYINILGCKHYNFGNICNQCQNNYILVNNLCCDSVCMEKIFSKFNQQVIKQTILNNTQILQQLIPFIEQTYIKNSTARLVALQAKDYLQVRRFALLYEFYNVQEYTTKRLIIDYQMDSQIFIPIDWSQVEDSPSYASIIWNQISNQSEVQTILGQFSKLYSTSPLLTVQIKKAVLSEINQYIIVSQTNISLDSRDLYLYQKRVILLTEQIQQNIVSVASQTLVYNQTNSNQTTVETDTQLITQEDTTFVAYTNTYSGDQIATQQLVNAPLNQTITLIQSLPGYNYTLTIVKQSSKVFGLINFIIIGENRYVIIRYVISYSNLTKTALITDQSQQPKIQDSTNVAQNSSGSYTIQDGDQLNVVYFEDSIPTNMSAIINQTLNIVSNTNSQNVTQTPVFRRMVVTTPITGAIMLEVALVYSNPALSPYAQTFYFWIYDTSNGSFIYTGTSSKIQTPQVYANPLAYRLSYSDPSVFNYPFDLSGGNYFNDQTINSALKQALIKNNQYNQAIWNQYLAQTQKDRNLVQYKRLNIKFGNSTKGMIVVAYFNTSNKNISWIQQILYDTTITTTVSSNLTEQTTQQTTLITSEVYIIKEGNLVHTFYPAPIPQQVTPLMNSLNQLMMAQNQTTSLITPQDLSASFRRMIITTALQNALKYEVALVYSNVLINKYAQTFYYYIVDAGNTSAIFCGSLLKIQTPQIYSSPWAYPMQQSDPSVFNYPFNNTEGNYFAEQDLHSSLLAVLSAKTEYPINLWSSSISVTQCDRFLVKYKRIRIDFGLTNGVSVLAIYDYLNNKIIFDQQTPYNKTVEQSGTTQTAISTDITGSTSVITNDISNLLSEDQVLQSILQYIALQKPIVSTFAISTVQISQYELTLEYQILYVSEDGSTIHATVVHTKQTHDNNLINFQITQVGTSQPTSNSSTITIQNGYVYVPTVSGNVTTGQNYNYTNQTQQTSTNQTSTNQTSTNQTSTNQTSTNQTQQTPSNETQQTSTNGQNTTQSPPLVTSQERTQQMIDYVLQQLVLTYNFTEPKINQILSNIDESSGTIKLNLVAQNTSQALQNYSVIVIGKLQSQLDPIIEQVKLISIEVANSLTTLNPTNPPTESTSNSQVSQPCNSTININGQQVCHSEGSSGEIDITPTTDSTDPSSQAIQLVNDQSVQESWITSDGQVIKTSTNPNNSSIANDTQEVLNLITTNYQQQTQNQGNNSAYIVTILMIQEAATTVTIQYALTVKFSYQSFCILKRYFYVRSVSTNVLYFMGIQPLPSNFDITLPQNRFFKVLQILQKSSQTDYIYQGIIQTTKAQEGIALSLSDIQTVNYRIYPYGYYLNAYASTPELIGASHIVQIQNKYTMIKWTQQLIQPQTITNSSNSQNSTSQSQSSNSTIPNSGSLSNQTTTNSTVNSSNTTAQQTTQSNQTVSPSTNSSTTNSNATDSSTTNSSNTDSASQIQVQQQIDPSQLVIDTTLQQKLGEVLVYLSQNKPELTNSTLQQYATTQSTNLIQFDLYFVKFLTDTLVVQYITSVTRSESNGTINIILFQSNQINLGFTNPTIQMSNNQTSTSNTTNTTNSTNSTNSANSTNTSTSTTNTSNSTILPSNSSNTSTTNSSIDQSTSTGYFPVDPNQIYYSEAMTLINQDPRNATDIVIDLSNVNSSIDQIIRYIRVNYLIILDSGVLKIVNTVSSSSLIARYVIYFYKESTPKIPYYQIYKVVINKKTTTKQTTFYVQSFILYASNHQVLTNTTNTIVKDQVVSNIQDTDIAYGYQTIDPTLINQDSNVQNVIAYIQLKYGSVIQNKTIFKVEKLELSDGRMNYKIIYSANNSNDISTHFKFVVFYQPNLNKVLVLNTINLPQNSQYNQLSSQQQTADTLLTSVIAYISNLHPQQFGSLNAFKVKSVSKKISTSSSTSSIQYQLILTSQTSNKKFRSFVHVASNQIDMKQISFGQIVEVSLDHYRLDQFDQIFIMNYQKLDYDQLHTSSSFRMVLAYLYNTKPTLNTSSLLGAAFKPYSLGFLYKLYFITNTSNIVSAEVYIESYSDKISLKSFVNADFDTSFNTISATNSLVQQIILLIKAQQSSLQLSSVNGVSSKDFLYGTLYKLQFASSNITEQFLVYHDHSTQEISIILSREVSSSGSVLSIQNCSEYKSSSSSIQCSVCNQGSELLNNYCILLSNCGALCQKITL